MLATGAWGAGVRGSAIRGAAQEELLEAVPVLGVDWHGHLLHTERLLHPGVLLYYATTQWLFASLLYRQSMMTR